MNDYSRDIIFLLKEESFTKEYLKQEMQLVHKIVASIDNDASFCRAHELVKRNRITSKRRTIVNAINRSRLKPFYFLINKN
ncbi:hypothetical protein A8C56_19785 [Niabella ginsenosidivorans]|uniref:Uncharacterized protein n=1 Tax=Niabella ginsenosidivorans TaxID=1176587 RepID=A0A1A9I5I2_9BACT|nr:hypothetical protein A8C56_19785 [Niabella ginsenosidivorans]